MLRVFAKIDDAIAPGDKQESFEITVNVVEFIQRNLSFSPPESMSYDKPRRVETRLEYENPRNIRYDFEATLEGPAFDYDHTIKNISTSNENVLFSWIVTPIDTGSQPLDLHIKVSHAGDFVDEFEFSENIRVGGWLHKAMKDYGISLTELIISAVSVAVAAGYLKRREKPKAKSQRPNEQNEAPGPEAHAAPESPGAGGDGT